MKIDMHCHLKEGSLDGKITVEDNIRILQEKGFQGMLITDHNTYNAYRHWKEHYKNKAYTDFVVLKGIEYDTKDSGHMIIIMPEGVKMRLLELRGLPTSVLIDFVHRHGGIIGPAHPCGEKYLSFTKSKKYIKNPEIMKRFDFIEIFNACESEVSNDAARALAVRYHKPGIGGSDSHRTDCIGMGYTLLPKDITCESELIELIKSHAPLEARGNLYMNTTKDRIGKANNLLVYSFWFYNKMGAAYRHFSRKKKFRIEH